MGLASHDGKKFDSRFEWAEDHACCLKCKSSKSFGFPSYDDNQAFEKTLKQGEVFRFKENAPGYFTKPKVWFLGFGFGGKYVHGGEVYVCNTCNQQWAYSESDYAWRGFFKPIRQILLEVNKGS